MRFHFQQFFRAVILAAFAIYFMKLHYTGEIASYINPKYDLMSQIATGLFIFLFLIQIMRTWGSDDHQHKYCPPGCTHDHGYSHSWPKKIVSMSVIVFPLLTGFTISPAVLDSSIGANKGTVLPPDRKNEQTEAMASDTVSGTERDRHIPLTNENYISKETYNEKMKKLKEAPVIQMERQMFAPYFETIQMEPKAFIGKKIILRGFVYKEEGLNQNQLVVSRFNITHCIADASLLGLLTEFEQASELDQDTWIQLGGTLDVTTYNGVEIPIIKAEKVEVIEEPDEPYVYPTLTIVTE